VEAGGARPRHKILWNEVHNAGAGPVAQKFTTQFISVRTPTYLRRLEHIHDNYTCRAVQFHSSPLCGGLWRQ